MRPQISFRERTARTSRILIVDTCSFVGFMMFQAARQWIPQAGVARRLGVSPRPMIRRLVDGGELTVRRISGCQDRVLADGGDCLVAQEIRKSGVSSSFLPEKMN